MEKFIDTSLAALESILGFGDEGQRKALNVIQIVDKFLDRFEGKNPIKPEMRSTYLHAQPWQLPVQYLKN